MLDMDGHNSTLSHKIILIRTHPERWNNYSPVNVMPGANMLISVIYSFLLREVTNKTSGGKKRNGRETNEKERSEDDRRAYTLVWMNTCRPWSKMTDCALDNDIILKLALLYKSKWYLFSIQNLSLPHLLNFLKSYKMWWLELCTSFPDWLGY